MEKKEYLKNRFKRDFLQYSLLQEDSLPAAVIANELFKVVDFRSFVQSSKIEIERLLDEYLSFDKVKIDGKLSNKLSVELEFGMQHKLIAKFQQFLETYSGDVQASSLVRALLHNVEKVTWNNGIINMALAVTLLLGKLNDLAQSYVRMQAKTIPEAELLMKYNEAKKVSVIEKIKGDNYEDIIAYRNVLKEYVAVKCENLLCEHVREIVETLRSDAMLAQLPKHFTELHEYALQLQAVQPELTPNEDWDKEYDKLVPTDFYCRNVADITSEYAFQMVLFQHFAKNEEWLLAQGMLVDNELKIYTDIHKNHLLVLLEKLEEMM